MGSLPEENGLWYRSGASREKVEWEYRKAKADIRILSLKDSRRLVCKMRLEQQEV